jgi:hypothetical protein
MTKQLNLRVSNEFADAWKRPGRCTIGGETFLAREEYQQAGAFCTPTCLRTTERLFCGRTTSGRLG